MLVLSGLADPIASPDSAARLVSGLSYAGAAVTRRLPAAGHGLTQADVRDASQWLQEEELR